MAGNRLVIGDSGGLVARLIGPIVLIHQSGIADSAAAKAFRASAMI
jgi:hypothetical protein